MLQARGSRPRPRPRLVKTGLKRSTLETKTQVSRTPKTAGMISENADNEEVFLCRRLFGTTSICLHCAVSGILSTLHRNWEHFGTLRSMYRHF